MLWYNIQCKTMSVKMLILLFLQFDCFKPNAARRLRGWKGNLRFGVTEAVKLTDKRIKRLGCFKGNLNKLWIAPCNTVTFKHMRVWLNKRVKCRFKLWVKVKLNKGDYRKARFFKVNICRVRAYYSFLFKLFNSGCRSRRRKKNLIG